MKTEQLEGFLRFATKSQQRMWDFIRKYPPKSLARYRLYRVICPQYVNARQSHLNLAVAEARANGELAILGPRLEALDAALNGYAWRFVSHPGPTVPKEPSDLSRAIDALVPYIGPATVAPPVDHGDRQPMPAMTLGQFCQWIGEQAASTEGKKTRGPDVATAGRWRAKAGLRPRKANEPLGPAELRKILAHVAGDPAPRSRWPRICRAILRGAPRI